MNVSGSPTGASAVHVRRRHDDPPSHPGTPRAPLRPHLPGQRQRTPFFTVRVFAPVGVPASMGRLRSPDVFLPAPSPAPASTRRRHCLACAKKSWVRVNR